MEDTRTRHHTVRRQRGVLVFLFGIFGTRMAAFLLFRRVPQRNRWHGASGLRDLEDAPLQPVTQGERECLPFLGMESRRSFWPHLGTFKQSIVIRVYGHNASVSWLGRSWWWHMVGGKGADLATTTASSVRVSLGQRSVMIHVCVEEPSTAT